MRSGSSLGGPADSRGGHGASIIKHHSRSGVHQRDQTDLNLAEMRWNEIPDAGDGALHEDRAMAESRITDSSSSCVVFSDLR